MKLRKIQSLVVAEAVISILQNAEFVDNICDKSITASIECYQNGREHGFILCNFRGNNPDLFHFLKNKAYYICQNRRSDAICIYKGEYFMQSISDDAYKNPKCFDPNEQEEAARWIAEDIQKEFLLAVSNK